MNQSRGLIITFLFCLTIIHEAAGAARHALFRDSPEKPISQFVNPVVINDLIIYQVIENQVPSLWSYNTLTTENSLIFTGELKSIIGEQSFIHSTDSLAYFVSGNGAQHKVWQTDGTADGTRPTQISAPTDNSTYMRSRGDTMFTFSGSGQLVGTDGNVLVVHDISDPQYISFCPFDINDVIGTRIKNDSNDLEIVRSRSGQVSVLSDVLADDFSIVFNSSFYINGTCYVKIIGQENNEVLIVPKNGESRLLSQDIDLSRLVTVFPFKDRVYAWLNSGSGFPSSISRFNEELNGFDADFFDPLNGSIINFRILQDYIIVDTYSSGIRESHNLNPNLTLSPEVEDVNLLFPSGIYPTADKAIYTYLSVDSSIQNTTLSFSIIPGEPPALTASDGRLLHVINNENSETVYLMLQDYISRRVTTYSLSETPDIDYSINGIWHDPNMKNQGMVITPGTRFDGSKYLFVTVYTYENGQPLWLAGVEEVQLGQTSIELLLANYNGLDIFETGMTPNQEIFGSIKIDMTGCNTLRAELNSNNDEIYLLNLTRIDSIDYSHLCIN